MAATLQDVVDDLAADLSRSVSLEDRRLRLICHSAHTGEVDRTRFELLLTRAASPEAVDYVVAQGVLEADGPVAIAPNPALGIELARLCVPVRYQQTLLGFLLVIEGRRAVAGPERELCVRAAEAAGALLYRERILRDRDRERADAVAEGLLDGETAASAAADAAALGLLAPGPLTVVGLAVSGTPDPAASALALAGVLRRVARTLPERGCLVHAAGLRGYAVLSAQHLQARDGGARHVAEQALAHAREALPDGCDMRAGLGAEVPGLEDVHRSRANADAALRVAAALDAPERVSAWAALGADQLVSLIAFEELPRSALPAGLAGLFELDAGGELVRTLGAYLDSGGDARATAEQLGLHRATLYHRLRRVEAASGLRLDDGDDRLALHLGMRLARLAGLLP